MAQSTPEEAHAAVESGQYPQHFLTVNGDAALMNAFLETEQWRVHSVTTSVQEWQEPVKGGMQTHIQIQHHYHLERK